MNYSFKGLCIDKDWREQFILQKCIGMRATNKVRMWDCNERAENIFWEGRMKRHFKILKKRGRNN
jgi:hypothetical protein